MSTSIVRRHLKSAAKLSLGLAIVAYLVYQAQSHQKFEEIWHNPKNWSMLGTSLACVLAAVLLMFARWYLLVRAMGLPFKPADAFRLGSLGFALNFVGPGGVGGDVFKSVAIARENPSRKSVAVASVVADRIIGLVALLVVTSGAVLLTGLPWDTSAAASVRALASLTVGALAVSLVASALLMAPGRIGEAAERALEVVPVVGRIGRRMFAACQVLSRRPNYLLPAVGLGIVGHLLLVLSFYTVAAGLPLEHPPLADHFCIVPLAETAGAIPLTPGGLGTTEAALSFLYAAVGSDPNSGLIVALGQRIVMLSIGVVAIGYFLTQRRELESELSQADAAVE